MCRNITTLRGLEPAATDVEIEAGARQYVRKITGHRTTPPPHRPPLKRPLTPRPGRT
jgi:hypothetical protein